MKNIRTIKNASKHHTVGGNGSRIKHLEDVDAWPGDTWRFTWDKDTLYSLLPDYEVAILEKNAKEWN